MIDFACKNFSTEEIIKCSFGLTRAELKIFNFIKKNSEFLDTRKIAERTNLDMSTVQRSLKKLFGKGIIYRKQKNLKNGGYSFEYKMKNRKEVDKAIIGIIDGWSENIKKELTKW